MLVTLRIAGFAIVDQVEVQFGPGLNVLTGETGAGKSVLVDALHLVLGGRMSAEVLREGAEEVVVEALFDLPAFHPVWERLAAAGLPAPAGGGEVLVRRTASRSGRGRAFVNGALCTVGMLEAALRGVVDLTGQHEHVALLDEAGHTDLLDAFAGLEKGEGSIVGRYRRAHAALAGALRERAALLSAREERARRAEWLAFQLRELEALGARPGEDEALEGERQVLAGAERLASAARGADGLVYAGEGSAAERLGRAVRQLAEPATLDPRLEPTVALLRSALAEAEEAGRALARYAESVEGDPERLEQVTERLEALRGVARKHGGTLEAALDRAEAMRSELREAEESGERLARVEREAGEAGREAAALAAELSRARAEAAAVFAREVRRELGALAMSRCRLEVAFAVPEGGVEQDGRVLGPGGAERARILLAPNPGEGARPLARIASGGELSRVLLAVKSALARVDPVATYVFDEADAGIGGGVAEAVGRLLAEVARQRQVLCVTHLPQVAAFADRHLVVKKRVHGGRTAVEVAALEAPEARRGEVARMLGGAALTATALEHARVLIAAAQGDGGRGGAGRRSGRRAAEPRTAPRPGAEGDARR
jgi:DNA repair protein RecN (Recombination protein N)